MKVIAFLTDHVVVDRIIDHLKLSFAAERPPHSWSQQHRWLPEYRPKRPPECAFQDLFMVADPPAEYFP